VAVTKLIIDYFMSGKEKRGFSLVEVMVVVSTVSVVMAVTMPAMTTARSRARAIVCRSNLRQLVLANMEYANDHDGSCVPAADDLWASIGTEWGQNGYHRWHGERTGPDQPFDPKKGPLFKYLGGGKIKECPTRVEFIKNQPGEINFENGCGGYGYNMTYIGSKLCRASMPMKQKYAETARLTEIKKPAATVMFTDTAFYQDNQYLIEYSFAEPPNLVVNGKLHTELFATPSIHFRHYGFANVGWADGHVEAKPMANMQGQAGYDSASAKMNIGWFEPVDNTLFDLE
jgi:prepilin-type processing-associated H-X9-DG protein/prepilin-type N-terminal cleavage/methylation domain-containing protein